MRAVAAAAPHLVTPICDTTSSSNSLATGSGSGLLRAASLKSMPSSDRQVLISAAGSSGKEYTTAAAIAVAAGHGRDARGEG